MITLGVVANVDTDGVYVTMPGSRGLLRGPYESVQNVVTGDRVLIVTTDDGEQVVVGLVSAGSDVLSLSSTGTPSGMVAPVGSVWRQTDANSTYGNLSGLLWHKVGTGTTLGTDWLVDFEGRWVSYTPTVTGWAKGDGTPTGSYTRWGKTMAVRVQLLVGSSTTQDVACIFSLPAGAVGTLGQIVHVNLVDTGSNRYAGVGYAGNELACYGAGTSGGNYASLVGYPFVWAAGDYVQANAVYEIA